MILAMMKLVMAVVTSVVMMLETAHTVDIIMKRNWTPLDLKTFLQMIVMMR